ncbi:LLM class flavin-dependent oxidoreductase [Paenibacillus filicis]|uniref:LLM class flavin-dependent oxidoreductase n=1 Tax=Paenibacillus filicis TaxID=669464 RepID=A0ABU9DCZ2_9BACL
MGRRKLVFGAALSGGGENTAVWRHPRDLPDAAINLDYYKNAARKAESGKLDFVFVGDSLYINAQSHPHLLNRLEPLTLLTALAGVTSRIGLVATLSTTYTEPYNAARLFASLDLISDGRAGWNMVTSALEGSALNFSKSTLPDHDERYLMAEEFVQVVKGLWNSWEDDAFVVDKEKGIYFDPSKLHVLNHQGNYYSVQGPLNITSSKQGHPVLVQAGSSEAGKAFSSRTADIVFTHQHGLEEAKRYYREVKDKAAAFGRSRDELFILPGIGIIIGDTPAEAERKYEEIAGLVNIKDALTDLAKYFNGIDLYRYPLDEPFPTELVDAGSNGYRSAVDRMVGLAKEESLTLRQLALRLATPRNGSLLVGTPDHIADTIQEWFEQEAADGFIISPGPIIPEGINDFVDKVIPLLQERGLYRTEYETDTLRGHLGL